MWRKKVAAAAKLGEHGNDKTEYNHPAVVGLTTALVCCQSWLRRRGDLTLGLLQLVGKGKLGSLLLQLDELALHVTDGDGELVDLEIAEDDLTLQEEHLAL